MSYRSNPVSLHSVRSKQLLGCTSMLFVEKTRGGVNLKKKMPTRVEDAGIRASGKLGGKETSATASEASPLGGLFDAVSALSMEPADPQFGNPSNVLEGESYSELCLTQSILSRMPDINFKNPFLVQAPSAKDQVVYMAWGYKLKSLPSSQKGSAYADKYAVKLWAKTNEVRVQYPVIATSVGYRNKITTEYEQRATGNLVTTQRVDSREFQASFDEMKGFPIQFRLGGSAKSVDGDNHIAWLVIAILRLFALKQAQETNSRGHITMSTAIASSFSINLEDMVQARSSASHSVATALANAWFGAAKPGGRPGAVEAVPDKMFEMVLPSTAADVSEVVYLAYLSGMLDDSMRWRNGDEELGIQPMFSSIRSSATERMKIPLVNASRAIPMADLRGYDSDLELGRAEAVFNSYVRRHELQSQVNVARRIALLAMLDTHSSKSSRMLLGLPKPCHVVEYDLWVDPKHFSTSPLSLIATSESAGLLMALSQMQATMRNDILVMKLIDHLESKGTPVLSSLAYESLRDWIYDAMPSGFSSWSRGWLSTVTGTSPPEIRRLANDSVHGFWTGLNATLLSGTVHVSAMLYYGEKPRTGALKYIWDENQRVSLARQKFVTGPQSKVLKFLYSGKANIFDTNPTDWMHYLADFSKRRDTRKIDSSLGVRSTNTVTGEPRLIYLGLRPAILQYEERMAEAQDASGIASHYEPAFDFNSAISFSSAVMNLGAKPKDGRHADDPDTHDGNAPVPMPRKRSNSVSAQLGVDKISPAGRLFSELFKVKSNKPKSQSADRPDTGKSEKLFEQGGVGSVRATLVHAAKDAQRNGLAEILRQLKVESSSRLEDIPDQLKNPEHAKGSEILEIGVEEAFDNIEKHFNAQDIEYTYAPLGARDYREFGLHASIQAVKGDGRCGVRSLQTASVVNNLKPYLELDSLFKTESQIMGLQTTTTAPATHMADDYSLASVAAEYGFSVCIVHYHGNIKRNQKGIRFYKPRNVKNPRVLYVHLKDSHYDALKVDNNFKPVLGAENASQVLAWLKDSAELAHLGASNQSDADRDSDSGLARKSKPQQSLAKNLSSLKDSESESASSSDDESPPMPAPKAEKTQGGASRKKRSNRKTAQQMNAQREAQEAKVFEDAQVYNQRMSEPSSGADSGPSTPVDRKAPLAATRTVVGLDTGKTVAETSLARTTTTSVRANRNHLYAFEKDDGNSLAMVTALRETFEQLQLDSEGSLSVNEVELRIVRECRRFVREDQWAGTVSKYRMTEFITQIPHSIRGATSIGRFRLWKYLETLPGVDTKVIRAVSSLALAAGTTWDYMAQDHSVGEDELMYYIIHAQLSAVTIDFNAVYYGLPNTKKVVGYTTYETGCRHNIHAESTVVFIRQEGHLCAPYITRKSADSLILEMKDISNYSKLHNTMDDPTEPSFLAPTRSKELWVQSVNTEIAKMGATSRRFSNLKCDQAYWEKALSSRTCIGSDPDDTAENNIELLSCFADYLGCPDDVSFFRTEAIDWLVRVIGWVPADQSWFGAETVMLLALHRDFRVWVVEDTPDLSIHNLVEHKSSKTQSTLPLIMSVQSGKLRMHQLNLPARAGSSMENLALACLQHRHNGTYPEPSEPTPTLPTPQRPDDLKLKNPMQGHLLGWVIAGSTLIVTVGLGVVSYRHRKQINGLVKNVRDMWKGTSVYTASIRALEEVQDTEPLLGDQNTPFTKDAQPGPLSPYYEDFQQAIGVKDHLSDAGSVRSLRTVPIGDHSVFATGRWPGIVLFKRWWGNAGEAVHN
nr:MAG: hypothetical protein [Sclerotinia sclerotiorum botybirnavirus 4]